MAFTVSSSVADGVARLVMTGELDAASAGAFKSEIEKVAGGAPTKLVLVMNDLTFMASAGLRVLIFAKQKLGAKCSVYMVRPQNPIRETLSVTGFDQSVYVVDEEPK